ncbi:MAG TPA: presenilin family intramembrane aspartyl protease [Candidatus Nanoarchaeia archaeon]|nr:presenilin family intramembrane aspartyl protease [Candidatus Nanoarchaeia archaeon]
MKHKLAIILVLLGMFLVTQFIGLYVVNHYSQNELPYGMEPPEEINPVNAFPSIIIAFIIAIALFFLLTKFKIEFILKLWFLIVIVLALGLSINSFLPKEQYIPLMSLIIALPFALIKVFNRNIIVHNTTELLIYPGIAAVFVPLLNIWTMIILLILISIYDMWAVWKSKIMQKMAKYQINTLKIFSGFFIPYLSKKEREKIKMLKQKYKKSELKKKKIKINIAILGGGDVIFPIISAGVMLKTLGIWPAIFVILGAALGLSYLLFFSEKKKFYPAMPFITVGIFLGMLVGVLVF